MKTKRRDFLRTTGTITLGSLLVPGIVKCTASGGRNTLPGMGIQTYTVNSLMASDPKAVFEKLAEIGFENIETASYAETSYYGFKPAELKILIEDLGMKWIGHHVLGVPIRSLLNIPENPTPEEQEQLDQLEQSGLALNVPNLQENMQQLVDEAAEGGLQYLVCAATAINTMDQIKSAIDIFSRAGEACQKAGIQFAYHNHATEWDLVEGTTAYDMILSQTDESLVKMELDLGWAATAKKDPVELFKGNPGRFPLWHIKDFDLSTNTPVPVGTGQVDFKPAFAEAGLAGMKYFFYEQDTAQSMEEVQLSYDNMVEITGNQKS